MPDKDTLHLTHEEGGVLRHQIEALHEGLLVDSKLDKNTGGLPVVDTRGRFEGRRFVRSLDEALALIAT